MVILGVVCVVVAAVAFGFYRHSLKMENDVDATMSLAAAVGSGILAGVFFGGHFWLGRKAGTWAGRRQNSPNEPWKWWPGWRSGTVSPRVNARVYYWRFGTAVFLCAFLGWLQDALRHQEATGKGAWTFIGILGVTELVLIGLSLNVSWLWWRHRGATLRLITFPVPVGGRMEAMIQLPYRLRPAGGFQLRLLQIQRKLVMSNKGSNTQEEEIHRVEVTAQAMEMGPDSAHSTTVPVGITLPPTAIGGDPNPADYGYHWRLQLRADVPGENLLAEFPVPVFRVAQQ